MNDSLQNTSQSSTGQPAQDQIIHYMLKAMEARVEELRGTIHISKEMLPLGVDTDLTNAIKKIVEDPLAQLLTIKNDLDSTISSLITVVAKKFFDIHKDIVSNVFSTDTGVNKDLHFSIVLKKNTFENRSIIMSFLREYKSTSLWETFPIYFQFVPREIMHKVSSKETILE